MTTSNVYTEAMGKVEKEVKRAEDFIALSETEWIAYTELDDANLQLSFLRALKVAIERHGPLENTAYPLCKECTGQDNNVSFPCPELTEITKELGI